MNRLDRRMSILIQLQSKQLITAREWLNNLKQPKQMIEYIASVNQSHVTPAVP